MSVCSGPHLPSFPLPLCFPATTALTRSFFSLVDNVRFPFSPTAYADTINGAGYTAFNPAAAAAAAAVAMGVHSTTDLHPVVPHSAPLTVAHSTHADANHLKAESSEPGH